MLAGGEDGAQVLVGYCLITLPRGHAWASFSAAALTQQATALCGATGRSPEIHGDLQGMGLDSTPPHSTAGHRDQAQFWLRLSAWAHPKGGLVYWEEGKVFGFSCLYWEHL